MTEPSQLPDPRCGWRSDLPTFSGAEPRVVRLSLESFVREASLDQLRAWDDSIPWLQRECGEVVRCHEPASTYTAILEYELPRESRRPDVILLEGSTVVVLELKSKDRPTRADLDQVHAYARDLRAYHAACAERPVHAVLVPSRAGAEVTQRDGVHVVGPAGVHRLLLGLCAGATGTEITPEEFLDADAYAPLPTLVRAARELFQKRELPKIWRARAKTDPAVERITAIALDAARTKTRRLVLLTGVPGSGKTLVGLRLVHAGFLDDLAVARGKGKPAAPAVFLSGNDPLVAVLQDALRAAGGGGRAFVQRVQDYVRHYGKRPESVPPEHLLVFDEAQRAWDAAQVDAEHSWPAGSPGGRSEPELFVSFAERIPEWCVVVGLIGTGQEINSGEEGGLVQWRRALEGCGEPARWTVHAPAALETVFEGSGLRTAWAPELNLDTGIRQHLAPRLHEFVEALLEREDPARAAAIVVDLHAEGHRMHLTRDLEEARAYARERYADAPHARFGLLASARDKDLPRFGIENDFQTTKRLRVGPWYNAPPEHRDSCCRLELVATEFAAQGLELDVAIVAWGSDLLREDGRWSITRGRRPKKPFRDPERLRCNVYRVLLTRGRDGTVIFVPPDPLFDETARYLRDGGLRDLGDGNA